MLMFYAKRRSFYTGIEKLFSETSTKRSNNRHVEQFYISSMHFFERVVIEWWLIFTTLFRRTRTKGTRQDFGFGKNGNSSGIDTSLQERGVPSSSELSLSELSRMVMGGGRFLPFLLMYSTFVSDMINLEYKVTCQLRIDNKGKTNTHRITSLRACLRL